MFQPARKYGLHLLSPTFWICWDLPHALHQGFQKRTYMPACMHGVKMPRQAFSIVSGFDLVHASVHGSAFLGVLMIVAAKCDRGNTPY